MKKIAILSICFITALVFYSCEKKSIEGQVDTSPCAGTPGPLFTAVRGVLTTNCALSGCHITPNAQNGINFTDNCTIIAQKNEVKVRAVDQAGTTSQMPPPPSAPLSSSDRQKITNWIAAGGRITD